MIVVSRTSQVVCLLFFQAEDGIRDLVRSRGLGDVYKRQAVHHIDLPDIVAQLSKAVGVKLQIDQPRIRQRRQLIRRGVAPTAVRNQRADPRPRLAFEDKHQAIAPERRAIAGFDLGADLQPVIAPVGEFFDALDIEGNGLCGCGGNGAVSYTHLRAHETVLDLVCRLLLEKKKL